MHHATPMCIFQCRKHLPNIADAFERAARPRRAHLPLQVFAFDELHYHGNLIIGLKSRVQLRDVRMRQACQHTDFAQKAIRQLRAAPVGAQQFQRFHTLRDNVAHTVDFADSSRTELAQDFVIAKALARLQRHGAHSGQRISVGSV